LKAPAAESPSAVVDTESSDLPTVRRLLQQSNARTVLEFGFVSRPRPADECVQQADWVVQRSEPGESPWDGGAARRFDAVLCRRALEYFPDEDLPWLVEKLFTLSDRVLHARVDDSAPLKRLPDGSTLEMPPRSPARWLSCF